MITKNISYVFSLLLHSILILLCIYFVELDKPKQIYNKVININLNTFSQNNNNTNQKEYYDNVQEVKKTKPIKEVSKKIEQESKPLKKKENLIDTTVEKKTSVTNKEIKLKDKKNKNLDIEKNQPRKQDEKNAKKSNLKGEENKNKINDKLTTSDFTDREADLLNKYNNELKLLIQKKATENYPRVSIRKREQGSVELIFSIGLNGIIDNIKIGTKTNASDRLIKSSIKVLNLISPYKKDKILKKKNTFSIIIVYKLN